MVLLESGIQKLWRNNSLEILQWMKNWDIHKKELGFDDNLTSQFRAVLEYRIPLPGTGFSTSKYFVPIDMVIPGLKNYTLTIQKWCNTYGRARTKPCEDTALEFIFHWPLPKSAMKDVAASAIDSARSRILSTPPRWTKSGVDWSPWANVRASNLPLSVSNSGKSQLCWSKHLGYHTDRSSVNSQARCDFAALTRSPGMSRHLVPPRLDSWHNSLSFLSLFFHLRSRLNLRLLQKQTETKTRVKMRPFFLPSLCFPWFSRMSSWKQCYAGGLQAWQRRKK